MRFCTRIISPPLRLNVLLFGDFKQDRLQTKQSRKLAADNFDLQLPPATSKPPFIMLDSVYTKFDFRVLRENRRITVDEERAQESEEFHAVLSDVALGDTTERVKNFVISAYVRGGAVGSAEKTAFEGSTSVFTKRRYRLRAEIADAACNRKICR